LTLFYGCFKLHLRAVSFGTQGRYGLGAFAVGQVCDQQFGFTVRDVCLQLSAIDRAEFALVSRAASQGSDAAAFADGASGHSLYGLSGDLPCPALDFGIWSEQQVVSGLGWSASEVHLTTDLLCFQRGRGSTGGVEVVKFACPRWNGLMGMSKSVDGGLLPDRCHAITSMRAYRSRKTAWIMLSDRARAIYLRIQDNDT